MITLESQMEDDEKSEELHRASILQDSEMYF